MDERCRWGEAWNSSGSPCAHLQHYWPEDNSGWLHRAPATPTFHRVQIEPANKPVDPITTILRCLCGWRQVCMTDPESGAWRIRKHFEELTKQREGVPRPRRNIYFVP